MSAALWAAVAVGAAVVVLSVDARRRLRGVVASPRDPPDRPADSGPVLHRAAAFGTRPVVLGVGVLMLAAIAGPTAAASAAVLGIVAVRAQRARVRRRTDELLLAAATRLIAALAGELRSGQPPLDALDAAAGAAPPPVGDPLAAAVRSARLGGDIVRGLRQAGAAVPGLARLAVCWQVALRSGAPLADVCDALAEELIATTRRRREMAVELAGPQATARLLAALPLVGLALGTSLGADPVGFLLHTASGAVVLFAGLGLDLVGLAWTRRLVQRAGGPS